MLILYSWISLAATSATGTLIVSTSFEEEGFMFEWLSFLQTMSWIDDHHS